MKKIFALLLAVMLIVVMSVPASACTPKLKIPKVPKISSIKLEPKLGENLEKAVDNQVENHVSKLVGKIDFSKIDFSNIKFN
jgi:hypothetical protein